MRWLSATFPPPSPPSSPSTPTRGKIRSSKIYLDHSFWYFSAFSFTSLFSTLFSSSPQQKGPKPYVVWNQDSVSWGGKTECLCGGSIPPGGGGKHCSQGWPVLPVILRHLTPAVWSQHKLNKQKIDFFPLDSNNFVSCFFLICVLKTKVCWCFLVL